MGVHFNADEVFAMAVKIEENAAAFYHRAAHLSKGKQIIDTLENLAKMEEGHKRIYTEMRAGLKEQEKQELSYDPNNEAVLYLNAMADAHGGEGSPDVAGSLTGNESLKEIVGIALNLEKNSILYYVGLIDLVPERLGKDKINRIINEEKKHVVLLSQLLAKM